MHAVGKESTCNAGDLGLILGLGRSPEEGKGYPLQFSGLENSMDCTVHGVAKSQTRLSNFHFYGFGASLLAQMVKNLPAMRETQVWSLGQEDPLENGMATHSSILAWRISWTEEPGRLQSVGSQRVQHDWVSNTHIYSVFWGAALLQLSLHCLSLSCVFVRIIQCKTITKIYPECSLEGLMLKLKRQ